MILLHSDLDKSESLFCIFLLIIRLMLVFVIKTCIKSMPSVDRGTDHVKLGVGGTFGASYPWCYDEFPHSREAISSENTLKKTNL